jgi:16S rRNA (guanine527-N7)-methyltransferase
VQFAEALQQRLAGIVELSPLQLARLATHYEFLVRWNERLNLTSAHSLEEAVERHYCESLFFGQHLGGQHLGREGTRILDLGSGAGFPGVPMAVLRPDWELTLVESHQRKAVFLRECSRGLPNVTVIARRAEEILGQYDWVVSRAVDPPSVLKMSRALSSRVGLMIGQSDVNKLAASPSWVWEDPVLLPWGEQRVCLYGRST